MKQILIPYIATGLYYRMYWGFSASLDKFAPGHMKHVKLFTDKVDKFEDDLLHDKYLESVHKIEHLPWPIVALMKFKYILDAIKLDNGRCDYVFYFNSNQEFQTVINSDEMLFPDKLTAAVNCGWDYLGHDPLKFTYGKPVDPKSKAHIPTNDYTYVQSSMFGGPRDLMISALEEMHEWTCYDLAHNRIPCFHDESYWNKWVYQNPDKVQILPVQYNACKLNMEKYGTVGAKIAMRDSSKTQYIYKDKYHE